VVTAPNQSKISVWRGRLALRVEADQLRPESAPSAFSAAFELSGSPRVGELTLYTPLGGTAAALSWTPQTAVLRANGSVRYFDSLDELIRQTVGTELPVATLFAWLAGDNLVLAGWSADLSEHANGRITARRTEPEPAAELRLVLEN
jgi:outer membrane lipoprotein LolB